MDGGLAIAEEPRLGGSGHGLGAGGVEKIVELKLLPDERAALDKSIAAVKDLVAAMDRLTGTA